jgi:hypothetical protein
VGRAILGHVQCVVTNSQESRVPYALGHPGLASASARVDYPTTARRPRHGCLATAKAERALGYQLTPWREALQRFLGLTRTENGTPSTASFALHVLNAPP